MIICHCRGLTDRDLRAAADARDPSALAKLHQGGSGCGGCTAMIQSMVSPDLDPGKPTE